jgi:DNA-binding GntR family transcriptional regulator
VLAPGERFSEDSLVERYGFGKAAIRSALVRLRHDGLVSGEPRRAHRVSAISPHDGAEINEVRLLLEPEAARLAALQRTAPQLRAIERAARTTAAGDIDARADDFLAANRDFHVAVAVAAGNTRIVAAVEALLTEGERVLFALVQARPVASRFGAGNLAIAAAIADQDVARAGSLMRKLLHDGRKLVADARDQLPFVGDGDL